MISLTAPGGGEPGQHVASTSTTFRRRWGLALFMTKTVRARLCASHLVFPAQRFGRGWWNPVLRMRVL
jgi:hypothetical protein